ncbi:NUDIX domain-containing protein [Desulfarculales bacterium]
MVSAQNPQELLPVADGQDRLLGLSPRWLIHQDGLKYRAVHILLLDPQGRLSCNSGRRERTPTPANEQVRPATMWTPERGYQDAARRELCEEPRSGGSAYLPRP